jgi:hypothetical protein
MVTKHVPVTSFSSIEASSAFFVTVAIGAPSSVTVRVDDNIEPYLDVGVSGRTLHLGLGPGTSVTNATLEAQVTAPPPEGLGASGAARIRVTGPIDGPSLHVSLSGAGTLDAAVDIQSLAVASSGASQLTLFGQAARLVATASGASQLGLTDLEVRALTIDLSGASSAQVEVTETISASLSGASSLVYRGTPTFTKQEVSGGSSITRAP